MSYVPRRVPQVETVEELRKFVEEELELLARALSEQTALDLRPVFAPPARPREGMIVSADGVQWNPGSGAGSYEYRGGAWIKL